MRRIIAALLLVAGIASAGGFNARTIDVPVNANTYGSTTVKDVSGYVEEILVDVPGTSQTGTVSVIATRSTASIAALSLATNVVTADYIVRPVVSSTDGTGGALTSPAPRRPLLWGETVTVVVTNASTTNVTWSVVIKTSDQ
jgi:hypothetical protein